MAKAENKKVETINCVYLSYTSCHFNIGDAEFNLHNNETYQLPDCDYVQSLIAQGKLVVKK